MNWLIVNVFLPSMHSTKVSFMRDVLSEAKLCLKQNEVNRMEVPCYQEISVKNLYEDAIKDEVLAKYLPTKEQLAGRLPEREFFFGLLCTLKNQYMKDIIAEAHKARYTVADDDPKKQGIVISDAWLAELEKHPYHSSKCWWLTFIEKPGTGIFLMKESSKLYRPQKEREKKKLSKRLGGPSVSSADSRIVQGSTAKRQNLGGGQFAEVTANRQGDTMMRSQAK